MWQKGEQMNELVTCVMPTADRPKFVPQAIRYFLQQDYPERELLILDSGRESVAHLVPQDARIRYVRIEQALSLGAIRNRGCELARGELIAHWDDDDWMADWRLSYQVAALARSDAAVCGLESLLFYRPQDHKAWRYVYPPSKRAWLAGGTLCYYKSFWERNRFPDVRVGEDTRFVWAARQGELLPLERDDFYIALIHADNTSAKRVESARWERISAETITNLLGDVHSFYRPPVASVFQPDVFDGASPIASAFQPDVFDTNKNQNHVIISLPCFGAAKYVRRAVLSLLTQTHRALTVVVVNDGDPKPPWPQLADIRDPRLVRFDLAENHGRYFADAVVLQATDAPFFAIQDADDWSEPTRIATLLAQLRAHHADWVSSAEVVHRNNQQKVERFPPVPLPLPAKFKHHAHHHALFRTTALRDIGGNYGGFFLGYDTLLTNFLLMSGRFTTVEQPLYHRQRHAQSLTSAAQTGMRSRRRQAISQQLAQLYTEAHAAYRRFLAGERTRDQLCEHLRGLAGRGVSAEKRHQITDYAAQLREQIANPTPIKPTVNVQAAQTSWSLTSAEIAALQAHLVETKPRRIVEVGSGATTLILAAYARAHDATVISLEHDATYYERNCVALQQQGLRDYVELRHAPLREQTGGMWYTTTLPDGIDFALIDGPPERFGRQANLFAIAPHLTTDATVWLHDADRPHEKACLALWRTRFDFASQRGSGDSERFFMLRDIRRHVIDVQQIGISILTGGRLNLLRQTIESLLENRPNLHEHHITVLVNGDDPATVAYVRQLPFVDRCLTHTNGVLPIGAATSRVVQAVAQKAGVEYVLHLEDDWRTVAQSADWLEQAYTLLQTDSQIGQVRLRHSRERVLPYHMVTQRPIRWQQHANHTFAPAAHYTFNPSLVRVAHLNAIFPCRDERQAQQNFLKLGLGTAQLLPGVFCHLGEQQSRRKMMTLNYLQ